MRQQVGLLVDRILESREAVVRGLTNLIGPVLTVLGSTLLGDGTPILILNPVELARIAGGARAMCRSSATASRRSSSEEHPDRGDSLSIRCVVSYSIRKANWNPLVAKDGLEALDVLQSAPTLPDIILLDIEMPGMRGYEFLAHLKEHEVYRTIPVVMMTSRSGDKHRAKAFALGAADYLTKPCLEEDLFVSLRNQMC